jgi:hypothetical protein
VHIFVRFAGCQGGVMLIATASRKAYKVHRIYPCFASLDDEAYRLRWSHDDHSKMLVGRHTKYL